MEVGRPGSRCAALGLSALWLQSSRTWDIEIDLIWLEYGSLYLGSDV